MKFWTQTDYKPILKAAVGKARGTLSALAREARCQPSYLLRVLHREAHLTPDQAFRVARYLHYDMAEREYFLLLVDYARAADPELRRHHAERLDALRRANSPLQRVVGRETVGDSQSLLEYHRDWRIAFLHFLSACGNFQNKERLAARLHLSQQELETLLAPLALRGLVAVDAQNVKFVSGTGHIPAQSPVLPMFLAGWRQLAVQKSLISAEDALHFTNIQTIGRKDLPRLAGLGREFIREVKKLCDQSASEEVVVLNLDLFSP
jgi:AraC-like DNA-binding protein